ncbi:prepilin-type N-terminal cleavage/methylation domain-containing protein [Alkalihalobacterium chitinilyticum]|uniref:Prepilin-type N-terminal cleavage/methylation domain-containing protein n=1 Tax=Alkalihalobacterium chitinilyticum TaxID=2980103 RepID=A0ABT5VAF7_9BACI|nr:prepilin-type N-terminal cleavage/methylation domain-containing protein [Alkalihalobacterium chitinilyticum]MDE5412431.1 prepilin-type N-terminal cleavage/methylation domain-containing protein [Alkalihalobacterium chitinilyticum]
MKALIQKRLKNQKGLTLIELLVVIVILGIIAAIAIPSLMDNRTNAVKEANAQTNKIVQDAHDRYFAITGSYAADATALKNANYLREIPKCANGATKTFTVDANGMLVADNKCGNTD